MVELVVESVTLPPKRSPPYSVTLLSFFAGEGVWARASSAGAAMNTTSDARPSAEAVSMI
jgi:hypothetical protein